jgi:hypothetical protein
MNTPQATALPDNVYVFNHLPNRFLHETWWQSLKHGNELALLSSFERTEARVASIILKLFKLNNCYHYEFNHCLEKLALMSTTDICKIIDHLGLCFTGHKISRSILKSEKFEYKQELGEDYYLFAYNTVQILRDSTGIKTSYHPRIGHLLAQSHLIGLQALGAAYSDEQKALKQRLILKLGKPSQPFIQGTSRKPLLTSQSSCIALIEAIFLHLGFDRIDAAPLETVNEV